MPNLRPFLIGAWLTGLTLLAKAQPVREQLHLLPRGKAAVLFADIAPERTAPPSFDTVTHMGGWDAYARSIVVDLGRVYRIDAVHMVAARPTRNKPHADGVRLFASVDNCHYAPVDATFALERGDSDKVLHIGRFTGFSAYARYVKIHNPYEGSETGFANRDAAEMPRIYSVAPDATFPTLDELSIPGWVVPGPVRIAGRVTGVDAGIRIRASIAGRDIPVTGSLKTGNLTLDMSNVPPGDVELALALHVGDNPFAVARTERVLTVFTTIHTSVPEEGERLARHEGVRLTDLTQLQESAPGHAVATPYRTATGLAGTWVVPHKHQSNGFIIQWAHKGRFALTAGVGPGTERVSVQFGANTAERWRFCPVIHSDAVHLRELFLGTFECGSGAMRIRLSLPAKSGAVAYVKIRPWRNPLASVVPPLGDQRRVILDNDGYSAFCVRMMETPAAMARYSALYRQTAIRGVVWCIGNLSEVNYTSGVAPYTFQGVASLAAPSHARVRNALEAYARSGEDTLDAHLRIMRDGNLFSLTSLRVQHVPNPAYDKGRSFPFYDTHEQWRIHNRQGQLLKPLSYANAGVRDRALAIVDEVLARGPDVFLLELTRGVPFVGYHPDLLREYRKRVPGPELSPPKDDRDPHWLAVKNGPMTMLMRAIRNAADRHGKRLGRRIRIGAHVDNMGFRSEGIDLATWVDEGLVDMLVAGIGHGSDTITPVVDVAASRRLPVYGHIHAHFGGKDPTPDEERARARGIRMPRTGGGVERDYFMAKAFKLYSQGAAGIYIWDGFFYPAVADLVGDPDRVAQWYWLERPTRSFSLNVKTGK